MSTLHDRINRVIHAPEFEQVLEKHGIDLIQFQCTWSKESGGDFTKLPSPYQEAILAGEAAFQEEKEVTLVSP